MKVTVIAKNMELTDALKEIVQKKISKLEKYFAGSVEAKATLSVQKNRHKIEVMIPFNGVILRGEESTSDMYKSLDLVEDKLERQIRKQKTRLSRKHGESLKFAEINNIEAKSSEDDEQGQLVKVKKFGIKPMNSEEAILQMDLLGHNFFVYQEIEVLSADTEFTVSTSEATVPTNYIFKNNDQELSEFPVEHFYKAGFRQGMTLAIKKEFISRFLKYWKEDYNLLPHDALIECLAGLLGVGYNLNECVAVHNRHESNASGKAVVTLKSPKKLHIQELYAKYQGYYEIVYKVLQDNKSSLAHEEQKYYEFTKRRVENAQSGSIWKVIMQQFKDWKNYEHRSSQIRDIIFGFKKEMK